MSQVVLESAEYGVSSGKHRLLGTGHVSGRSTEHLEPLRDHLDRIPIGIRQLKISKLPVMVHEVIDGLPIVQCTSCHKTMGRLKQPQLASHLRNIWCVEDQRVRTSSISMRPTSVNAPSVSLSDSLTSSYHSLRRCGLERTARTIRRS